ncbi:unnamed protein product [Victoria cruziana]
MQSQGRCTYRLPQQGFYRCKAGDVPRVSGFKNKAPQFQFICRKDMVLASIPARPMKWSSKTQSGMPLLNLLTYISMPLL